MKNYGLKSRKIFVIVIAVTMFICSCKFGNGNSNETDPTNVEDPNISDIGNGEDSQQKNAPTGNDAEPSGNEDNEIVDSENVSDPKNGDDGDNSTPSKPITPSNKSNENSTQNVTVEKTVFNDSALSSYWTMLDNVAEAGQAYYSENFSKTRVITQNGYLFNKAADNKIDVEYLVANGNVPSQYLNKGIEVLLLDCADFDNYDGFRLKSSEDSLTVFASVKHPTENSYLLTTNKSTGGVISASQYASLLNSYYQNHGALGKLYPGTDEYNRILNFISMYESKYDSYFVRSVSADNKYAMVVLSGQSNTADVKQYVLRKNGGIWEVVLSNIESDPRVLITVNKALPDFNLDMIPSYTINDHKSNLSRDKSGVINLMIGKGLMSGNDEIKYICGTSNYCYVVLKNELKYICNNTGEGWNIVQVVTPDEAQKKMLAISKTAPTFIILDS